MRKREIVGFCFIVILFGLFATNIFGWNVYAYFSIGEKELIFAAANGVSHKGWADKRPEENHAFELDYGDDSFMPKTLVKAGPLDIFAEASDGMRWTAFAFGGASDYRRIEFPLLLWLVPMLLFFLRLG